MPLVVVSTGTVGEVEVGHHVRASMGSKVQSLTCDKNIEHKHENSFTCGIWRERRGRERLGEGEGEREEQREREQEREREREGERERKRDSERVKLHTSYRVTVAHSTSGIPFLLTSLLSRNSFIPPTASYVRIVIAASKHNII